MRSLTTILAPTAHALLLFGAACSSPTGPDLDPPTVRIVRPVAPQTIMSLWDTIQLQTKDNVGVRVLEFDVSDRLYAVRADFQKAEDPTSRLLLGDVVRKWLRIEVWEDDFMACPAQPSTGLFGVDQLLGSTTLQIGPDFERAVLSFGSVPRLDLEQGRK